MMGSLVEVDQLDLDLVLDLIHRSCRIDQSRKLTSLLSRFDCMLPFRILLNKPAFDAETRRHPCFWRLHTISVDVQISIRLSSGRPFGERR